MERLRVLYFPFPREFGHGKTQSTVFPSKFVHARAQSTGFAGKVVHAIAQNAAFPRDFGHGETQRTAPGFAGDIRAWDGSECCIS